MVSIFHSEMVRISQALPDMPVSILILAMSNPEEMTWRQSVMSSSISWEVPSLGKDYQADPRLRNMPTSKRRRKKSKSRSFARITQRSSRSSCTTAEGLLSLRTQTTATSSRCSRGAWRDTDMTPRRPISSGTKIGSCLKKKQSRSKCWMSSIRSPQRSKRPPERLLVSNEPS